ncbi:MAG TPA: N-6 DNA methylase [Acidimicrobiales bacterium]|nr:N-6 DNA methylase [Acidimicrobiales bacterium]
MTPPTRAPQPAPGDRAPGGDDGTRAAVVARTAARLSREAGVPMDPGLSLWALAGGVPGPDLRPVDGPADGLAAGAIAEALGAALEDATDGGQRRAQGLHMTPAWLAAQLAERALAPDAGGTTVCDPACGGGAFLVAAAERLHRAGVDRRDVVRHLVWGADVDPVCLAAAEAALALWAGEAPPPGRLVVGDPLVEGGGLWPGAPAGGFGAVVGNPPFQSQLGRLTARSAADRRRLRERYGDAVRAYTDTAWLFLLLGCELVRPGGRVVLVQPQSLVAARDAAAVRAAVDGRARLVDLWADDARVFAAAVRVCAPVLERRADPAAAGESGDPWGDVWARTLGLPDLPPLPGPSLGERATVAAGFRDEYYGLVGAVRERDGDGTATAPLVTSGTLVWGRSAWGERPVRFAKRRWRAPVVDLTVLDEPDRTAARRWVERTRRPKLVVATQTSVIVAAVDAAGAWVPCVPVVAVVPHDPTDLWHLAAAVASPVASAWMARRAAGTGLDRHALRISGPALAALPLPTPSGAWDDAAAALRDFAAAPGDDALQVYAEAAGRAYGAPAGLTGWWFERVYRH